MSQVTKVFSDERANGFSSLAPERLTWAVLKDAKGGAVTLEVVASVRAVIVACDGAMSDYGAEVDDAEEISRARALVPGLLSVLDILGSGDVERAWSDYKALQLLALGGLLDPPAE
jgi:hypothetical protein